MKLSLLSLTASVAVVSAGKYHHPPPEDYPSPPVYTPSHSFNTTMAPTKTIYPPPYPPPSTTFIPPPPEECPPVKTVTVWVNPPPKPTGKPEEPGKPGKPGEPEEPSESEGEQPPPPQTGPETVPTGAAASYGAPGALLAAGLLAAVAF